MWGQWTDTIETFLAAASAFTLATNITIPPQLLGGLSQMFNKVALPHLHASLGSALTKAASYSPGLVDLGLGAYKHLIVTLDVTSAERDSSDETYDLYVTMGDGSGAEWDIVHFPQIITTGAKRFVAAVLSERLAEVTTATPGVSAEPSATRAVITAGSNEGAKTLAAGKVRHGPFGNYINYYLVISGTVVTGIAYSVTISAD